MSEALYRYYERELLFIRQLAQEFAQQYPAAAGSLLLEPNRSVDPHVERLIESFAFLTARVQQKLDDDFPELTEALLSVLYPHYLAPIPSLAIVQFDLDHANAQPGGIQIARHSFKDICPIAVFGLTIQPRRWIPGTRRRFTQPAKIGVKRQENPNRLTHRASQMCDGGIHRNNQIKLLDDRSRVAEG